MQLFKETPELHFGLGSQTVQAGRQMLQTYDAKSKPPTRNSQTNATEKHCKGGTLLSQKNPKIK